MTSNLPSGYSVYEDEDGDWWFEGPADVILFSEPGEPLLLGFCLNEDNASSEAIIEMRELGLVS